MENRVLNGMQPERALYYFEEICKIPHGSKNTKQISDYLVEFAKAHGLRYAQDEVNNVVIYKDGTPGYEHHPIVILQGHMDMVAEKTQDSKINFLTDGLDLRTDGEYIWADGTTLGGVIVDSGKFDWDDLGRRRRDCRSLCSGNPGG